MTKSGGEKVPSLLSSLSASLLLLRAVGLVCLLLDTVDLFNHKGTSDSEQIEVRLARLTMGLKIEVMGFDLPISDFLVGKVATVWSADSSSPDAHPAQDSGPCGLDSAHALSISLLFDVLNGKLATWGLDCFKAV